MRAAADRLAALGLQTKLDPGGAAEQHDSDGRLGKRPAALAERLGGRLRVRPHLMWMMLPQSFAAMLQMSGLPERMSATH